MNDLPETTTSHTYILDQNEKIAGYQELSRSEVEAARINRFVKDATEENVK